MLNLARAKTPQQNDAQRQHNLPTSIAALLKWDPSTTMVEEQSALHGTDFENTFDDTPYGFENLNSAALVNQEFEAVEKKFHPVQAFYFMVNNTKIGTAEAEMASRRHNGESAVVDIDMLKSFIKAVEKESEKLYKAKSFDFAEFNEEDELAYGLNVADMYEKLIDMKDQTVIREFGNLLSQFKEKKTNEYENFLKYWLVDELKHLDLEESDEESKMIAYESSARYRDDRKEKRYFFAHEPIVHYNGKLYSEMTEEEQDTMITAGSTIRVRSEAYNEIRKAFFNESNRYNLDYIHEWSTGLIDRVDDGKYHGPDVGPHWPLYFVGVYIFGFKLDGDQPAEHEPNQFVTINGINGGMSLKQLHRFLSAVAFADFGTAWGRIYVESK